MPKVQRDNSCAVGAATTRRPGRTLRVVGVSFCVTTLPFVGARQRGAFTSAVRVVEELANARRFSVHAATELRNTALMSRVRRAVVADAEAVGAVHVAAARAAYRGVMPDDYLDSQGPGGSV
jgi:hypothetical protein